MKTELTKLEKVKKALGREIALATETLGDGKVTIEAEVFAEGETVIIISADGEEVNEPLPVNEEGYELDNGMVLIVKEEGVIFSIGEKVEEQPEEEEVAASDNKAETPLPKSIIESIMKETKFSAEEVEAKDLEITELKAKIEELEKVEEVEVAEVELSKKGAKHNPEEKATLKLSLKPQGKQTIGQSVMSKMANR